MSKVVQAAVLKRTKFIDKFLIYQFSHSLRPDFEPIRKQLLNAPTIPSIADVLPALIAEETRLCSLSPHSILAASQKTNTVKGSSSEHCEHCKKTTVQKFVLLGIQGRLSCTLCSSWSRIFF